MVFSKGNLKIQKQNSQSCNCKNCFLVFEQVIISSKTLSLSCSLEEGNIAVKKQTISGLLDFKTKFDSKMTGAKKLIIPEIYSYENRKEKIDEGCT